MSEPVCYPYVNTLNSAREHVSLVSRTGATRACVSSRTQGSAPGHDLWQEGQRLDVPGTHGAEVPMIQGRHLADAQPLRHGDHCGVGRAER
jgi:hypothetical protein